MPNFTAGTSFTDGVTNDVTAAKLNALVADAVPTSSLALASTSGTISNFTSSTATLLGAITGSTNVINIGSGQIYKDGDGDVYFGATSKPVSVAAAKVQVVGGIATASNAIFQPQIQLFGAHSSSSPYVIFARAKGSYSSPTTVGSSDGLGNLYYGGHDGTSYVNGAGIEGVVDGAVSTGNVPTALSFVTGNGFNTERLRITSSGNVGIGASPATKLHVYGVNSTARFYTNGDAVGSTLYLQDAGGSSGCGGQILFGALPGIFAGIKGHLDNGTGPAGTLVFQTRDLSGNVLERMSIDYVGNVAITGLAGAGSRAVNASAAGALSAASDASLKEEVVGAHIAGLNEILQIHPKVYRWKDDIANRGENASIELGFIANEVAPIIPSAAPLGNDGLYGFYDRSITAALVKAVQELKAENDSLKSRIEALEAK
jgi:hypothetical protein